MIERYLYLSSLIKHLGLKIDLTEMDKYVNSISKEEYKLAGSDSKKFMNLRKEFYSRELDMLKNSRTLTQGR